MRTAETAGPRGLSLELSRLTLVPRMLDGTPLYCCYGGPPTGAGPMLLPLTVWLVAIPTFAALSLVLAARRGLLPELAVLSLPATAVAAFYVLLPSFTTLRFLLPVFALLSLAVATALVEVLAGARGGWRVVLVVVFTLGLVGHLGMNLLITERVLDRAAGDRAQELRIAGALRPLVQRRPCLVAGPRRAASYYLGCAVHTRLPKRRLPPPGPPSSGPGGGGGVGGAEGSSRRQPHQFLAARRGSRDAAGVEGLPPALLNRPALPRLPRTGPEPNAAARAPASTSPAGLPRARRPARSGACSSATSPASSIER